MQTIEKYIPDFTKGKAISGRVFDGMSELADFANHNLSGSYRGDSSGFYGDSFNDSLRFCREGNMQHVAASDALMDKLQNDMGIETFRTKWADSVAGGFPNVPAAIAGHPLSMRTRQREKTASAPMAVVVDLTSSGGIADKHIQARGSAILALVRLLSAARPVELYVAAGLGQDSGGAVFQFVKVETAPLDLPRACYAATSNSFARRIGYGLCKSQGSNGSWPFNNYELHAQLWRQTCQLFLPHASEILAIPGAYSNDRTIIAPEQWARDMLATYAPQVELS